VIPDLRRQDDKNRQNSIDDFGDYVKLKMQGEIQEYFERGQQLYDSLLSQGVAKECARFVLPLSTPTRIYMKGSARSWIHYINLRSAHGTQKEHMDIANECKEVFKTAFPDLAEALDW
jgi:thymidylate synthase (FAD)